MGLLLVDVFLGWGRLVFNSLWTFTLIWVPLIVVPDSSPRACGGVGILLQRLYVGYESSWSVLGFTPSAGVWVPFSGGACKRTRRV
jgi:hypothetical protein